MTTARSAADIAALAQLACLLEVSAPKPGNVSPGRHFADLTLRGLPDQRCRDRPAVRARRAISRLAKRFGRPIEATACWTKTNTNLGIVLLLAPLARPR